MELVFQALDTDKQDRDHSGNSHNLERFRMTNLGWPMTGFCSLLVLRSPVCEPEPEARQFSLLPWHRAFLYTFSE